MRVPFISILLLVSSICFGQWGQYGRNQPRLEELRFTLDTFWFKDDHILLQRFDTREIVSVYSKDVDQNLATLALFKLLPEFDARKAELLRGATLGNLSFAREQLDIIREHCRVFDRRYLEAEYRMYYKYRNVLTDEEQKAIEDKAAYELAVVQQEDSNVITPFDSMLVARTDRHGRPLWAERYAEQKIRRIEDARRQYLRDSTLTAGDEELERAVAARYAKKGKSTGKKGVDNIQKFGPVIGKAINEHRVEIGWDKELCRASWGTPLRVGRNTTLRRTEETWYYAGYRKLVFIQDVLIRFVE
ncbi:MAG: hypothetical protein JNM41_04030 [Flavipsychrobacter sp.]|nr:hypothetical protein [Flavipsychrobacter sp.]